MAFAAVKFKRIIPVFDKPDFLYDFTDLMLDLANFEIALATFNAHWVNQTNFNNKFYELQASNSDMKSIRLLL